MGNGNIYKKTIFLTIFISLLFTNTETHTTLHTHIDYYYTYHSAKVKTNPDEYALRNSKSLSSITYIALFIIALSAFFLKIHTITRMRHPFSTLYCSCSQCILFTNCGVNSSKISSRRICKCPILDMVTSLSDCTRYFQFELVYRDTPTQELKIVSYGIKHNKTSQAFPKCGFLIGCAFRKSPF